MTHLRYPGWSRAYVTILYTAYVLAGGWTTPHDPPYTRLVVSQCLVTLRPLRPTSSFYYSIMSQVPSASTSSSNFEDIFSDALKAYKKQTKKDIASHPLAAQIKSCDSSSAIIAILRTQVQNFDQSSQGADERWTKWLDPTVNVLFAFSATLGNGVGVVSSPKLCSYRSTL